MTTEATLEMDCGYEPEYSEPVDMGWLETLSRKTPRPAPRERITLMPKPARRVPATDERATLSLVGNCWESPLYQHQQLEELRLDGTAAMIRIAYDMEQAALCFQLESDPKSLITAEPHLRRCTRALNHLTRAAAKARHFMANRGGLFDGC